ncbi:MAG: PIN domain-containing protein [Deltaproteobacteria bacterium]|nr:PIN domain-containing protein [Deltaproteobacteria bacterium]MBW2137897.1 PIN domain-containing protein [Deltaproteobacteria bacterium]
MKTRIRVYLDTSVVSALYDETNPERRELTRSFFEEALGLDIFISDVTIAEIERTPEADLREKMKSEVAKFSVIELTNDAERLAEEYLRYGAVPDSYPEDEYHVAVAVLNDMDFLLSWNFRHLVRRKTRDIVKMVNTLKGFRQIEIMTPAEIL